MADGLEVIIVGIDEPRTDEDVIVAREAEIIVDSALLVDGVVVVLEDVDEEVEDKTIGRRLLKLLEVIVVNRVSTIEELSKVKTGAVELDGPSVKVDVGEILLAVVVDA